MALEPGPSRLPLTALLAALLLPFPGAAAAQSPGALDPREPPVRARAELDVFVNEVPQGTIYVVIEGREVYALRHDLLTAGVMAHGGRTVEIDGVPHVSLSSLAPSVRFVLEEQGLALRITVPPELLGRRLLDLRPRLRPADYELLSHRSAFLDWSAQADTDERYDAAFEAGGRVGPWLGTTGVTWRSEGGWVRGLTSAVRDDVERLERWTLGDTLAASGALGGSVLLAGAAWGREYSLDPYFVGGALPSTTTVVTTPSTLELRVNGALVREQRLEPGYWDVVNLPVVAGQSVIESTLRDAFGREQTLDSSVYFSAGLLRPGLSDYGVAAGFQREEFGIESFSYGAPAAVARYRWGFNDRITPGLRAEGSLERFAGGASATVATPLGELEAAVGASAAEGETGVAAKASWLWRAQRYSLGLRLGAQSERYANLSLAPETDRPLLDAQLAIGLHALRRVSLAGDLRVGRWRDAGDWATAGLRASMPLGGGAAASLYADYGRVVGGDRGLQLMAMVSWGLPGGHGLHGSTARARDGGVSGTVAASRGLPRGTGWGYRVQASEAAGARSYDAHLQGQTSFGRAELQAWQYEASEGLRARASGGVVYIDRGLHLSRPTGGAFALVKAGEVADVGVTLENGDVGLTGADGRLMVTGLQPYYGSRLALRDADIPIEYDVTRTVRHVAAPLRGGAIVDFDLKRVSAITGRLSVRLRGQTQIPANGRITALVDGDFRSSPVTPDGRFFLERMPLGKHVLRVTWGDASCRVPVILRPGAPPVFDAGDLRCIADVLDPESSLPVLEDPAWADLPVPFFPSAGAGGGEG